MNYFSGVMSYVWSTMYQFMISMTHPIPSTLNELQIWEYWLLRILLLY